MENTNPISYGTYSEILIGNSRFDDDIWDLSPLINSLGSAKCDKLIRFENIKSDSIKLVVKNYLYYKLGKVKPRTVIINRNSITYILKYCTSNGIISFEQITTQIIEDFNAWLRDSCKISKKTGYMAMLVLEEIIRIGSVKKWSVPSAEVLIGHTASEIWGSGCDNNSNNKFEPIPENIFQKIVACAIEYEYSLIARAGILIQSQTGLRISEVLSIKSGCLHKEPGRSPYFEVYISKTSKAEPILHKVYANELVVRAIEDLEKGTKSLREESGMQELFLRRNKSIGIPRPAFWSSTYLKTFIRRCDIRGENGELYHLRSHQFRPTFVRHLVLKGLPISFAMKQFAHVSVEMTSHYLMLEEKEIKELYAQIILNPNNKLVGVNAEKINNTKKDYFKGKATNDYETCIQSLSEGLSFNPLPGGICLYDYRRDGMFIVQTS